MTKVTGNFLLPNQPTYVVLADSAESRIFLSKSRFGDWTEVETLQNVGAATREIDRVSDRPGRAFDRFGKGRHAMEPAETNRQHEVRRFANLIGKFLNNAFAEGKYQHLVFVAEPSFLGCLRKEMSAAVTKTVHCEIPMNVAGHDMNKAKLLFE